MRDDTTWAVSSLRYSCNRTVGGADGSSPCAATASTLAGHGQRSPSCPTAGLYPFVLRSGVRLMYFCVRDATGCGALVVVTTPKYPAVRKRTAGYAVGSNAPTAHRD